MDQSKSRPTAPYTNVRDIDRLAFFVARDYLGATIWDLEMQAIRRSDTGRLDQHGRRNMHPHRRRGEEGEVVSGHQTYEHLDEHLDENEGVWHRCCSAIGIIL